MPADVLRCGCRGLGHLGIQFASKFLVLLRSRLWGAGREERDRLPRNWEQTVYIDNKATNAAEELQKLGGAQGDILATAPSVESDV